MPGFNTILEGDADEPLYIPAKEGSPAIVYYRNDYASSALHEISHWVIAGKERRLLEDYGYWYESDGRNLSQQQAFEQVEVKPQAIELLLHYVVGLPFRVSVDNLALPEYDASGFEKSVNAQVIRYLSLDFKDTLPERAMMFINSVLEFREISFKNEEMLNQWLMFSVQH